VAITFDDGYRDNYEHAWPILKKYGIPATFFLVAGALDNKMVLWWDRVGEVVKELSTRQNFNSQNEVRTPEWMSALLKELYNGSASQTIARRLVQRMNSLPREKRQESFDALIALSDYPSNGESDLMLTWDQVKELENSGMQIGAHTITHAFLDELNEEVARKEIEGSIKALERQLQIPICFFSYPRGRMDERVKPILKKSGVKAAVTTKPGSNPYGTDLLELKRIDAGYFLQNRGFDPSTFEAELQGWFSLLRGK
jgi:peptidoglycan/xylan/chitin deacetylase (PgdA/CDA1 family)